MAGSTAPILLPQIDGTGIFTVGRVGYETGTQDTGGVYIGTIRSGKISPLGPTGYCKFRRLALRIRHNSSFTVTVRAYVDDVQTKVWDANSEQADQEVVFTQAAPTDTPAETVLQLDLTAAGISIEFELLLNSDEVQGMFLPESVEVHFYPVRKARRAAGQATT